MPDDLHDDLTDDPLAGDELDARNFLHYRPVHIICQCHACQTAVARLIALKRRTAFQRGYEQGYDDGLAK